MIDVHCHFDMAKNPVKYISDNETLRISTIGMTNLPSHFQLGINHIKHYRHIRLALGLHPLRAEEHVKEYPRFLQSINETSYIGEVGLDFSKEGFCTKDIQLKSFEFVLDNIKGKKKILSIHSRRAEMQTLEMLLDRNIQNAIFHWYSGPINVLKKIADAGFFFSINSAMILSDNGKKIISKMPKELILTETDFPFIENSNIANVYVHLSDLWNVSLLEVEQTIDRNFKRLINRIV